MTAARGSSSTIITLSGPGRYIGMRAGMRGNRTTCQLAAGKRDSSAMP